MPMKKQRDEKDNRTGRAEHTGDPRQPEYTDGSGVPRRPDRADSSGESRGSSPRVSPGPWEDFAFFLTGILGLTALAGGIPDLILPLGRIAAAASLMAALLFLLYTYAPRLFYPAILAGAICGVIWLILHRTAELEELTRLSDWIYGTAESSTMTLSVTAVPMAGIIVLLLFLIEFPLGAHIIVYAAVTALLAAAAAGGARITFPAAILLGVFNTAFWAARGRWKAAGLFVPVFLAALLIVTLTGDSLYNAVNQIDGSIRQAAGERFPNFSEEDQGLVNRGNNTQDTGTDFTLTTATVPEESIYLTGFHGGVYGNSRWTSVDSDADSSIRGLYYKVARKQKKTPGVMTLSFSGSVISLDPYFADAAADTTQEEQTRKYFTELDIDSDWNEDEDLSDYADRQSSYQKSIRKYTAIPEGELPRLTELVQSTPLESLNEITAFIIYTLQSRTEYTLTPGLAPAGQDIVEYFLFDSGKGYCQQYAATAVLMYRLYGIPARYVTGYWISPDQFVSYENGSAQAHVTGQNSHAWPEIFIENYGWVPVEVTSVSSDGGDLVHPGLTVSDLHQIMRDHGWEEDALTERDGDSSTIGTAAAGGESDPRQTTAAESAPETSAAESAAAESAPQASAADESSGNGSDGTLTAETEPGGAGGESSGAAAGGTGADGGGTGSAGAGRVIARILITLLIAAAAAAALLFQYVRYRTRKFRELDYLGLYAALTDMLRDVGRLPEGDGTEKDYPERLHRSVPSISEEDAVRLREVTLEAAYGPEDPTRRDTSWLRRLYIAAAKETCDSLSGAAKLRFRLRWLPGIT